jgi:DNA mismatch repair ATPase MutL
MSIRVKAFKPADEYRAILDMLQAYAIHNSGTSIACKKSGGTFDVNSLVNATTRDNIGAVYGAVARELVVCNVQSEEWAFGAHSYCSMPATVVKKPAFILFINRKSHMSSFYASTELLFHQHWFLC